jgi:aminodeoxyfutalosine deaminase
LPALVAAGVPCSVSTDDPAMFGTDLGMDYAAAAELGVGPRLCYAAAVRGALCDERTRSALERAGAEFDWAVAALAAEPQ